MASQSSCAIRGDFIPVNRIVLGMDTENNHEEHQCRYEAPSGFGVRQPSGTFDWSER
jgi:hypothetical protein